MLQELRDYWLPLMLMTGSLAVAAFLLLAVGALPFAVEYLPAFRLFELFAEDTTVRRCSIASAVGLTVTALVFFRPRAEILSRRSAAKRSPPPDVMAGA